MNVMFAIDVKENYDSTILSTSTSVADLRDEIYVNYAPVFPLIVASTILYVPWNIDIISLYELLYNLTLCNPDAGNVYDNGVPFVPIYSTLLLMSTSFTDQFPTSSPVEFESTSLNLNSRTDDGDMLTV